MKATNEKYPPPARLVCGREMTTAPENYSPAQYRGRRIHFCTEFCLDAYNADPERFYAAHSRNAPKEETLPPAQPA